MSENFDLDSDSQRAKRSAELEDAGPRMETSDKESPAYPSSLLAGGKLSGRGNAPVRAALMRQVQRTHGNRAAQRFMQRSAAKSAENDEDISQRIQSKAGSGNSLDKGVQGQLEQGLGADLSGVRVHTDSEADHLAHSVDSIAFTTGQDIFFRSGQYNPGSQEGMKLLAHEATHTVQQAQGPVSGTSIPGGVSVSDPSDSFEQAADHAAESVVSGGVAASTSPGGASPGSVQRQGNIPVDEEEEPVQQKRDSSSAYVQREAAPEEEEEIQQKRDPAMLSLQREAAPEEEEAIQGKRDPSAAFVQREVAPEDEEEMVQGKRDPSLPSLQREAAPEEEEEAIQQKRHPAALSAQRQATAVDGAESTAQMHGDPNMAGPEVAALPSRGPLIQRKPESVVIQRSFTGSFPVKAGGFEMGMETKEGAAGGSGKSGMSGTIKFLPTKDTPYTNKIGLVQIVKLADAGGANVNPVSLPTTTGPHVRTTEDKAKGVEGGFFTDVLHNDPFTTKKAKSAGDPLASYYPFSSSGGQVFGFKRSDDAADMKGAELFDFPGTSGTTSNLDFSFETVAKADDSGDLFGAVKWAFGLRAGKVVNEKMEVNEGASATWKAALEKHQDFYVHEPVTFYFGFDSDELESGEDGKIDGFLDYLRRFPDVRLDLAGFADQRGKPAHNRALALRRAERVAQALISKGIEASRINAPTAKGATTEFTSDAATDQDTEANRRGNRRVMLTFIHTATPTGGTP